VDSYWTIIGVTTFGPGSQCGNAPDVFTRVTSYLGWLDQILGTTSNVPTTNKWPWHAFIYGNYGKGKIQFGGTGTLIMPQWILTSARVLSWYKISLSLKEQSNLYFQA
jgi:secreted trypsin-like serine protease